MVAAAGYLDAALATPGLPDSLRARGLVERSVVALRARDLGNADEAASAARDLATRVGDPHLAGVAERIVGLVAQSRGDSAAARAALERSVAMAVDDPDVTASIAATTALALTIAGEGEVDEAMVLGVRAVEACRRIGDRHLEAAVENHLADLLHEAGRDDARDGAPEEGGHPVRRHRRGRRRPGPGDLDARRLVTGAGQLPKSTGSPGVKTMSGQVPEAQTGP